MQVVHIVVPQEINYAPWPDDCAFCNPSATECCLAFWCSCVFAAQNAQKSGTGTFRGIFTVLFIATFPAFVGAALIALFDTQHTVAQNHNAVVATCVDSNRLRSIPVACEEPMDEDTWLALSATGYLLALTFSTVRSILHMRYRNIIAAYNQRSQDCCPACCWYFCGCHCLPLMQERKVAYGLAPLPDRSSGAQRYSADTGSVVMGQPVGVPAGVVVGAPAPAQQAEPSKS